MAEVELTVGKFGVGGPVLVHLDRLLHVFGREDYAAVSQLILAAYQEAGAAPGDGAPEADLAAHWSKVAEVLLAKLRDNADRLVELALHTPRLARVMAEACLRLDDKPVDAGVLDGAELADLVAVLEAASAQGAFERLTGALKNAGGLVRLIGSRRPKESLAGQA